MERGRREVEGLTVVEGRRSAPRGRVSELSVEREDDIPVTPPTDARGEECENGMVGTRPHTGHETELHVLIADLRAERDRLLGFAQDHADDKYPDAWECAKEGRRIVARSALRASEPAKSQSARETAVPSVVGGHKESGETNTANKTASKRADPPSRERGT